MRKSQSLNTVLRNSAAIALMVTIALAAAHHVDSAPKRGPYKRVKPNPNDKAAADTFFPDVFRDGLKGERPAGLGSGGATRPPTDTPTGGGSDPAPMNTDGVYAWSKLISAATIEDEIKRINREVEQDVTTPSAFNGLGHKKCRKNFSLLGMLFAITGEYDGDVRWKDDAPAARDLFARAGRNCKVGTPASYNESKLRKQDLADMVAGSRLQAGGEAAAQADWSQACERSEIMKRIEKANARLRELTANAAAFKSGSDDARHEAEILVAMAEVLQKDDMPDGVDDDYKAFCQIVKKGAQEIVDAQKLGNVEPASKAMGSINKACDDCHETYRG